MSHRLLRLWNYCRQKIVISVLSAVVPGEKPAFGLIEGYDRKRGELIMKRIDSSFEVKSAKKSFHLVLVEFFRKGFLLGK